jgi:hypothetical protein
VLPLAAVTWEENTAPPTKKKEELETMFNSIHILYIFSLLDT